MGFWDVAAKVGKGVINKVADDIEKCQNFREEYRDFSDDSLKNKLKSGTIHQRSAAKAELQSRGYQFKN